METKRKGYTLITNDFWSNPELNYKEKIILGELLSYSDDFKAHATIIAKNLNTHRNRIYDSLPILLEKGYIKYDGTYANKNGFDSQIIKPTDKAKRFVYYIHCTENSATIEENNPCTDIGADGCTEIGVHACTEIGVLSINNISINNKELTTIESHADAFDSSNENNLTSNELLESILCESQQGTVEKCTGGCGELHQDTVENSTHRISKEELAIKEIAFNIEVASSEDSFANAHELLATTIETQEVDTSNEKIIVDKDFAFEHKAQVQELFGDIPASKNLFALDKNDLYIYKEYRISEDALDNIWQFLDA